MAEVSAVGVFLVQYSCDAQRLDCGSVGGFPKALLENFILHFSGVLEVLKGMQELGVTADVDTFHNYILPVFSSIDATQQALQVSVCVC